ncbi:MAG: hypothetical protein ABL933_08405 [Methyloglobulus sp.]|nr:hypothetical protein [Methyloglobulus sp.]
MKKLTLTSLIYAMALLAVTSVSQFVHAGSICTAGIPAAVIHTKTGLDFRTDTAHNIRGAYDVTNNATGIKHLGRITVPQGDFVCILCQNTKGYPIAGSRIWDGAVVKMHGTLWYGYMPDHFLNTKTNLPLGIQTCY